MLLALNDRVFTTAGGRQHKVSLHLAVVNVTDETVNPPRPCSPETLARLGFDGFAVDFIEAEPAVIAYLCQAARLHQSVRMVEFSIADTTGSDPSSWPRCFGRSSHSCEHHVLGYKGRFHQGSALFLRTPGLDVHLFPSSTSQGFQHHR